MPRSMAIVGLSGQIAADMFLERREQARLRGEWVRFLDAGEIKLWRTTFHESAHAVIGLLLLGGTLNLVHVQSAAEWRADGTKSLGQCVWGHAQRRLVPLEQRVAESLESPSSCDRRQAIEEIAGALTESDWKEIRRELKRAESLTRQYVIELWPLIERVANHLHAKKMLCGSEVEMLLRAA